MCCNAISSSKCYLPLSLHITETLVICQLSASTATSPLIHFQVFQFFFCQFLPTMFFFFVYRQSLSARVKISSNTVRLLIYLISFLFIYISQLLTALSPPVVTLSTMDHEPPMKKRGRPKGLKDKPRLPGDKPRGRPRKAPKLAAHVVSDASDAACVDSKSDSILQFLMKLAFPTFLISR